MRITLTKAPLPRPSHSAQKEIAKNHSHIVDRTNLGKVLEEANISAKDDRLVNYCGCLFSETTEGAIVHLVQIGSGIDDATLGLAAEVNCPLPAEFTESQDNLIWPSAWQPGASSFQRRASTVLPLPEASKPKKSAGAKAIFRPDLSGQEWTAAGAAFELEDTMK